MSRKNIQFRAFLIGEVLHIAQEQGIIKTNNLAQDLVILNHDKGHISIHTQCIGIRLN